MTLFGAALSAEGRRGSLANVGFIHKGDSRARPNERTEATAAKNRGTREWDRQRELLDPFSGVDVVR